MTEQLPKSTEILTKLKDAVTKVKDMKAELQPSLDAFDESKREKTQLTERLRSVVLQETEGRQAQDYFEGLISTYFDREFVILDEASAVRQVVKFADEYLKETGVDIIGSLLSVAKSRVEPRVQSQPEKFGLQPLTNDSGITTFHSKGMEIVVIKKVRVSANVDG